MRYDDTRAAFDCLRNCVKGQFLKSEAELRRELATRLDMLLEPTKYAPINPNGFAPIRGYNLTNLAKPDRKSHWSYKPRQAKQKPKAVPPTADQIIADL